MVTGKRNVTIDCVCAAHKMMNKVFSSEIVKKLCIECAILDVTTNTCPDMYAIINLFIINWSKIQRGKQQFVSKIPSVFVEMFKYSVIREFYDDSMNFMLIEMQMVLFAY